MLYATGNINSIAMLQSVCSTCVSDPTECSGQCEDCAGREQDRPGEPERGVWEEREEGTVQLCSVICRKPSRLVAAWSVKAPKLLHFFPHVTYSPDSSYTPVLVCVQTAQCGGFESHHSFFPWKKRAVLGVVDLFVVPLPFYTPCSWHMLLCVCVFGCSWLTNMVSSSLRPVPGPTDMWHSHLIPWHHRLWKTWVLLYRLYTVTM